MKKYVLLISILTGLCFAYFFEYSSLLLFIKTHARTMFFLLLGISISANMVQSNQRTKDAMFNFFLICWASFWFLCFEASYVPLYTSGQCVKGKYFNKEKFSLEMQKFKTNDSFGFMKYDVSQYFKLRDKYQSEENFFIEKKEVGGYQFASQKGLKLFVPVYEDIEYTVQSCSFRI